MNNISYFKLQAKNLYRDYKLDFMKEDDAYHFSPRFFDINRLISDFNIDIDDFSLMKAQHIIAKLVGFKSWDELIKAPESVLDKKKTEFENLNIKVKKNKIYHIDLSAYEKLEEGHAGDYIIKCPHTKELDEIMILTPNCYFLSCGGENLEKYQKDSKHVYVNICPNNSTIRVMIPNAQYPDWYAVSVKNI